MLEKTFQRLVLKVLEDDARPAKLRSCNPWGETKFSLQMRKGGLVSQEEDAKGKPLRQNSGNQLWNISTIFCVVKCGQLLIDSFTQVRVYDSVLVEELNYKAILISEETTVEDVIRSHIFIFQ